MVTPVVLKLLYKEDRNVAQTVKLFSLNKEEGVLGVGTMSLTKALSLKTRTRLSSTYWNVLRRGLLPDFRLPPYYLLKAEMDRITPSYVKLDGGWGFRGVEVIRQHLQHLPPSLVKELYEYRDDLHSEWTGGSDGAGSFDTPNSAQHLEASSGNMVTIIQYLDGENLWVGC